MQKHYQNTGEFPPHLQIPEQNIGHGLLCKPSTRKRITALASTESTHSQQNRRLNHAKNIPEFFIFQGSSQFRTGQT